MEPQSLERCSRCILPITWETVYYDDDGVCNVCKNWDIKQKEINWEVKEKEFFKIIQEVKEKNAAYDCIIPFSGGKDSTYTLWAAVKKYHLKCLVVSFDHWFYRPKTLENRRRTWRKLGVDVISFTPNWQIVKKLMLESLIRKGDFCWHCHVGVTTYPLKMALKLKVPLVLWGEGRGEYEGYSKYSTLEQTDEWNFNRRVILGMRAEDIAGFINVDMRDMEPYIYPAKEDIEKSGVISVPLGNFHPWDVQDHVRIIKKELEWQEDEMESAYPGLTYEKIECYFEGVRDYIKFLKRGFSRMTHLATLDIRHGRINRDQALELIKKYEARKPKSLEVFLQYLEVSENEFNEIVAKHLIAPAIPVDPSTIPYREKLWDQDLWFKDD